MSQAELLHDPEALAQAIVEAQLGEYPLAEEVKIDLAAKGMTFVAYAMAAEDDSTFRDAAQDCGALQILQSSKGDDDGHEHFLRHLITHTVTKTLALIGGAGANGQSKMVRQTLGRRLGALGFQVSA
jgi:hypothetical protein